MKILKLLLLLALPVFSEPTQPLNCAEVAQRAQETFVKLDQALKLKAGRLLGEMEVAKGALQGCLDKNEAVSAQVALLWFAGDILLVAFLLLLFFHQRRMQHAVQILSGVLKAKAPEHTIKYVASKSLYRWALGVGIVALLGLNGVALFL